MTGVVLGIVSAAGVVAAVWILGSGVIPRHGAAERLAAGVACCVLAGWAAMLQPLVRFSVLEHRLVLAVLVAALLAVAAFRAGSRLRPEPLYWPVLLAASVPALIALTPLAVVNSTTAPGPDLRWHEGWIRQLGGGMLAPAGPYDRIPNGYPWLYHAVSSWLELLPGGMSALFWAQEALVFVALATGVWLLARELRLSQGEASLAVLLSESAAGLGWLWVHHGEARFVTHAPQFRALHGDFIVSTALVPSLSMLPPAFPRDLSLAMGPLALWALLRGLRSHRRLVWLSGALVGALILTGPVSAVVILATGLTLLAFDRHRIGLGVAFIAGLVVVVLVWLAPFAVHYHRYGGVAKKLAREAVNGPETLTGVGLLIVLGAAGLALVASNRRAVDRRSLVIIVAVPLAIWLAWFAVSARSVGGVGPIGRAQRYLPSLALGLTFPAAIALAAVGQAARRFAIPAVAVLIACCSCSYVLAADGLISLFRKSDHASLFACSPAAPIDVGDHVALINTSALHAGEKVHSSLRNIIDDDVFRNTGAFIVYRDKPTQLRYHAALRHTASQKERATWIRELEAGRSVPGIEWVLSPAGKNLKAADIEGRCRAGTPSGPVRLTLYRGSQ